MDLGTSTCISQIGLLIGFTFLIEISTGWSQVPLEIDTIVVQSTRLPLPQNETGRNITVARSDLIANIVSTSLDDLLQHLPGVEVQSRNAFGVQGDISLRGSTFTQVLILVNGMKLNDPLTGHFNSYIPVSEMEIDRIEVLRGTASALYGADAVGGVINIITKGFGSTNQSSLSSEISYGENRLVKAQNGFSLNREKYFLSGGFSLSKSKGELIEEKIIGNTELEEYRNFFDLKNFGLSFGTRFKNNWQMSARTSYDDRHFSARYFYTTSPFDKSIETTQNWWNQLALQKNTEHTLTSINLAHRYGTDEFVFSPDFPSTNTHSTNFWNLNINHRQNINRSLSLNIGTQVDHRSIESSDRGNHSDFHTGIHAMAAWQPGSQWNLNGSFRLDYDQNYKVEFTPQFNASYRAGAFNLRGSVGRSMRAADYTERYVSYLLPNLTPGRSLGNPDLRAEESWSEELGLDYRPTPTWLLKATSFLRQSSNLIDYVPTNASQIPNNQNLQPGETYFYASNITDVNTFGLEFESWFQTSWNERTQLRWIMGYTYLNTSNDEDVISVYISSHAKHLINTMLSFKLGKLDIALNGIYKNRSERLASSLDVQLNPNYQVWNFRLGVNITDQLSLNLTTHNLLDEDYQDILGAPMPGRWLMGGIRFSLAE
ncbi:MAG: TonB-dependent receptor [Saprospiraceae bacterium]|nr:TonB-dependent receptor [Saprospiraceae bacterium]